MYSNSKRKGMLLMAGIILFFLPVELPAQARKILFIGNSYTTYDGYCIPKKVKRLAKASGIKVFKREHTKNGLTLQHHLANPRALSKISRRSWDYVVLQEQSWTATANAEKGMYPAMRSLDSLIQLQGSKTVLYMLMPKKFSKEAVLTFRNDSAVYYYTVFKDFAHAQDSLQSIHLKIANELDAITTPVGLAYRKVLAERPELKLFKKDNVHPTKEGAYLAACVFYVTLFGKPLENLIFFKKQQPKQY